MAIKFEKLFSEYFNEYPFFVIDSNMKFFFLNELAKEEYPDFGVGDDALEVLDILTPEEKLSELKLASPACITYEKRSNLAAVVPHENKGEMYYCFFVNIPKDKTKGLVFTFLSSKLAVLNLCEYLNRVSAPLARRYAKDTYVRDMYKAMVSKIDYIGFAMLDEIMMPDTMLDLYDLKFILGKMADSLQEVYFSDGLKHYSIKSKHEDISMSPILAMTFVYFLGLVYSISTSGMADIEACRTFGSYKISIETDIEGKNYANGRFPRIHCLESPFRMQYFAYLIDEFSYTPTFETKDGKLKVTFNVPVIPHITHLACPEYPEGFMNCLIAVSV